MTLIAEKLAAAGVKIPSVQERVWRIVRDNMPDGIVASRVADILNPSQHNASVSTLLSQMEARKMVYTKKVPRRVVGPHGVAITRNIKLYFTDMKEYELLAKPVKQTAATRAMDVAKASINAVKQVPSTVTPPAAPAAPAPLVKSFEELTIAEATALYVRLHKMFGGAK